MYNSYHFADRQALKTKCPTDFYVEHLSGKPSVTTCMVSNTYCFIFLLYYRYMQTGFEYHANLAQAGSGLRSKAIVADRGANAASQCDLLEADTGAGNATFLPCSVALIPFWMGYGNGGHSAAPPEVGLSYSHTGYLALYSL